VCTKFLISYCHSLPGLLQSTFMTNKSPSPSSSEKNWIYDWLCPLTIILATCQPPYLYDTLILYWPAHALHTSKQQLLEIPYMNSEFCQCSFSYCSPNIWNKIPAIIKASATVATFKHWLKSHFLNQLVTQITQSVSLQLVTAHTSDSRFPLHCSCY